MAARGASTIITSGPITPIGWPPPHGTRSEPTTRARRYTLRVLKRTQEIQDILLLALREFVKELSYDSVCFGPRTPVLLYGPFQISGSSVVKKKDALSQPPQGCGSKLSRRCLPLTVAVGNSIAHVVKRKVGVQVNLLCAQRCNSGTSRM